MENLIFVALLYLVAAVVAVPVAKRFGLGSVLGYLIAGLLINPLLNWLESDPTSLMTFAELGVVMMLFLVGLELNPRTLWKMRTQLLGTGGLQVVATAIAVALAGYFIMGASWNNAIAVGFILCLSSTAVVLQTLNEKGLLKSSGGKSVFSVLLFQDIAVIPILAFLPLLAPLGSSEDGGAGSGAHDIHHSGISLVQDLSGWQVTIVTFAAVCIVIFGGYYLSRPLFRYIAASRLREIFTAATLLLVLSITVLMSLVGLSPALGAFLAGVILATSEYRHELESNIEPFKSILLGLFFITVGAGINLDLVYTNAMLLTVSVIGLIVLKMMILYAIAYLFGIKDPFDKWLFILSLAPAGEFGFVLLSFAIQGSILPVELANNLLVVVALSMFLTPLLFVFIEKVLRPRMEDKKEDFDAGKVKKGPIIIAGHGRFGQVVDRMLLASGYKTVVLEYQPEVIAGLRKFGTETFYGDASRPDLLKAAGLEDAELLVVAIDDMDKAVTLIKYARQQRQDLHIIARAADRRQVFRMYEAGANDIVREAFDSSVRAGRYSLEALGMDKETSWRRSNLFVDHDRKVLRKQAQVWDPEISIYENEKYITLSRQLGSEIDQVMQGDSSFVKGRPKVAPGTYPRPQGKALGNTKKGSGTGSKMKRRRGKRTK